MPLSAPALTLAAAALNAGWNVLLAGRRDVRAATTVALVLSVLVFAPLAAVTWRVEASAAPWIAASAALELAYFFLLTAAYRASDVSLVYPLARGIAPVLVLVGDPWWGRRSGPGRPSASCWWQEPDPRPYGAILGRTTFHRLH